MPLQCRRLRLVRFWTESMATLNMGSSQLLPQLVPSSQANNAYIFPSIGWAATLTRCTTITDEVFLEAAEALAAMSSQQQLQQGRLFPPLSSICDAAQRLTSHLAAFMVAAGLGQLPERGLPAGGWAELVQQTAFTPAATLPQPELSKL